MSHVKPERLPPTSAAAKRKCRALVQHPPRRLRGKIVAVEVKTADCFVGQTTMEALEKGRRRHPDGFFEFLRAGRPFTHTLKRKGR